MRMLKKIPAKSRAATKGINIKFMFEGATCVVLIRMPATNQFCKMRFYLNSN